MAWHGTAMAKYCIAIDFLTAEVILGQLMLISAAHLTLKAESSLATPGLSS
jgi:hypothetical protein